MNILKRALSCLLIVALLMTSVGAYGMPTFATEYYEYPTATNITNVTYQTSTLVSYAHYKPLIGVSLKWNNIAQFSFDNVNWRTTNKNTTKGYNFYVREDYFDKFYVNDAQTIIPLSVNVIFVYVKEKNSSTTKVYQIKLDDDDLEHLYSNMYVPYDIVNVTDSIDLLPTLQNLDSSNNSHISAVNLAWTQYSQLSEYDKTYVFNYSKLYALKEKIEKDKISAIDWKKIYPDLVELPGNLTEQYYNVGQYGLNHAVYNPPNKAKIYETPLANMRYNNATISNNVLNDTTENSQNVFFTYAFSQAGQVWSKSMAKKVWGYFTPTQTGDYKFKVKSDDGHMFRMYLSNGQPIESNVFTKLEATADVNSQFNLHDISDHYSGNVFRLQAGVPYPIYYEYFNHGGNAALITYYQIQNSGSQAWVEMTGQIFRPSSAQTANTQLVIVTDLKIKTDAAKVLLDDYAAKIVATGQPAQDGYVTQAAYDALKLIYDSSMIKLNNPSQYTQAEINAAIDALQKALDTFKSSIYSKAKLINAFSVNQMGTQLHFRFDKETTALGYKIVLTDQNLDKAQSAAILAAGSALNGRMLDLKNAIATLGPNDTQVTFDFEGLKSTLKKVEGKPEGSFDLYIELGDLQKLAKLYVYAQAYNASIASDFIKEEEVMLKAPATFEYFTDEKAKTVTFFAPKVQNAYYMIEYMDASGQWVREKMAKGSNSLMLNLSSISSTSIASVKLAQISEDAYSQVDALAGIGPWKSAPVKVDIPKVAGLKIKMLPAGYTLEWTALPNASSYEVFSVDSKDPTKMFKLGDVITGTTYLISGNVNANEYYTVRAKLNTGSFTESAFSDPAYVQIASAVNVKNYTDGVNRKLVPDKPEYFVLTGIESEQGFYTVKVPKTVALSAYTTNVATGDTTKSIVVSYPEKAGQSNETFVVNSKAVTVSELYSDSGTVTYRIPSQNASAAELSLLSKTMILQLTASKHYDKNEQLKTMVVTKKLIDAQNVFVGESVEKTIGLAIQPNERVVDVTVKPAPGSSMVIKDGTASTSINRQTLNYRFDFGKGDAYKPIFEFVMSENDYIELMTSGFKFSVGTIGQSSVEVKDVYYTVKRDTTNPNKRIIRVFFDQTSNFKGKFIEVGVNFEPKVSNISSDAKIYNVLSGQYMDVSKDALWNIPNVVSSLLKPGVPKPADNEKANPSDYLAYGLGISTNVLYDDVENSGLTGDNRLITEIGEELKIELMNKSKSRLSF